MGGPGSGEWPRNTPIRRTVDECLTLCISSLIEHLQPNARGSLNWPNSLHRVQTVDLQISNCDGDLTLLLEYSADGQQPIQLPIHIQTTRTQCDGRRHWFTCPLSVNGTPCQRRVGKLYLPPDEEYFGCRTCHDLTYASSQQAHQYERRNKTFIKHALKLAPHLAPLLFPAPRRSRPPRRG